MIIVGSSLHDLNTEMVFGKEIKGTCVSVTQYRIYDI